MLYLGDSCPNKNLMPISLGGHELQILSWNGQGICVSRPGKFHKSASAVRRFAKNRHIVCFQEVHGGAAAILLSFNRWLPGWEICLSAFCDVHGSESPAVGGVVIAICPDLCKLCNVKSEVIVPGRCLSVTLSSCASGLQRYLHILNLHNFGFSGAQVAAVGAVLDTTLKDCLVRPDKVFAVLIGDFNFMARDDRVYKVGSPPSDDPSIAAHYNSGSRQAQWMKHLASWIEVSQPFPTHYSTKGNTCSRIDRAFVATSPSLLLKLQVFCSVIGTPEECFSNGESDHAPVALGFGRCFHPPAADPPIARWICKHPNFQMHLSSLTTDIDILGLGVDRQLIVYKKCLKEAARRVRNECLYLNPDGGEATKLVLASVSRALWFNNLSLAKHLIKFSGTAAQLIFIDAGSVIAHSYETFENIFGDFFKVYHRSEVVELQHAIAIESSLTLKKQLKSRLQCARRMQGIFWPTGKRLKLAGIKVGDNVVTSARGTQEALISHWKPIYEKKPCDTAAANKLLQVYSNRHPELINAFTECVLPNQEVFEQIIGRVKDSAVGPDGLPYSSYSADTQLSAKIFENTTKYFSSDDSLPGFETFNKQFVWFAPKGELDEDSIAVLRTPGNLRTIFGSNTDSKYIAAGLSDAIADPTFAITPSAQRGFCRGRQLSLNVVDLDSFTRAFNLLSGMDLSEEAQLQDYNGNIGNLPGTMLYDFCNAFPTLLHEWMWLVLNVLKIPKKLLKVIECLYTSIKAFSSGCGDGSFLFEIFGGVRTGCPLSSILFLLCCNPFIDLVLWLSDGPNLSVTRVCADDFGSALKNLLSLSIQAPIFDLASSCAGLFLKPSKCVLIITACNLTPFLIQCIRNWLSLNVPQFSDIIIADSGKFLGWHLGRHSATLSFAAPIKKFVNRVHEICLGNAPAAVSLIRYNQRVVPVLSYVSQFAIPPDSFNVQALAHRSVHSILRLPPNSFSRILTNSVGFCSAVNPLPINSYCASVRYRFAISEATYLLELKKTLFDLIGDEASVVSLANRIPLGGIQSPSILQCLLDALAFRGPLNSVYDQVTRFPEHNWILNYPISPLPQGYKGVQSAMLAILSQCECCFSDIQNQILLKAKITFGSDSINAIVLHPNWFSDLCTLFAGTNTYLRMCWLKAIGGAWTTTSRMHESIIWPCVFGCADSKDEFVHYMQCPILWQLAREALKVREDYFSIGHRLCFVDCSRDKLKLLSYCHSLYHAVRHDAGSISFDGNILHNRITQYRAHQLARTLRPLVESCVDTQEPDA